MATDHVQQTRTNDPYHRGFLDGLKGKTKLANRGGKAGHESKGQARYLAGVKDGLKERAQRG